MSSNKHTSFQAALHSFATAFVRDDRASGGTYYRIKTDAPTWLRGPDVMLQIHKAIDDRLPDDWIYEQAYRVAQDLAERAPEAPDDAREHAHEIADALVDVYNADRYAWLASHLLNASIVDQACEEYGVTDAGGADITRRIGMGQLYAIERIASAVIDACETRACEIDERREAWNALLADLAVNSQGVA